MTDTCENCHRPNGSKFPLLYQLDVRRAKCHVALAGHNSVSRTWQDDCNEARIARLEELLRPRWHALGADDVLIQSAVPVAMIRNHFLTTEDPPNVLMWSLFPLTPTSWTRAESRAQAKLAAERACDVSTKDS